MALDLNTLLQEALEAQHRLMIGGSVVEIRDQNGETVRYSATSATKLAGYIISLKQQLGLATNIAPMRTFF